MAWNFTRLGLMQKQLDLCFSFLMILTSNVVVIVLVLALASILDERVTCGNAFLLFIIETYCTVPIDWY